MGENFGKYYGNDLSPELIQTFMCQLNQIWYEREAKKVTKVQKKLGTELSTLKR